MDPVTRYDDYPVSKVAMSRANFVSALKAYKGEHAYTYSGVQRNP